MADRVARETRKCNDAQWNVVLAYRMQREQIVADKITVAGDDQRASNEDAPRRLCLERGDNFADLDVAQQMIKDGCGDDYNGTADRDADPAPAGADPLCK